MARGKRTQKPADEADNQRARIEVFTSPTCPHCPSAVKVADEVAASRSDVKVIETDTATQSGHKRAETFGIMSVPTVLVHGPAHDTILFRGAPMKKNLDHAVEIVLGKSSMPKKQEGFLSKIFG